MDRLQAPVPDLPQEAWVLLGGDALSALGSGLTLPFLLVYLHEVRGIGLATAGLALATIAAAVPLLATGLGGPLLVGLASACALAGLGALRLERRLPPAVNRVGRPEAQETAAGERLDVAVAAAS